MNRLKTFESYRGVLAYRRKAYPLSDCLVIIDCQTCFLQNTETAWVPYAISQLVKSRRFDYVICTVFQNTPSSFFMKQLHWDGCVAASDLIVHDAVSAVSERIFVKHSYSCFTSEFLQFIHQQHIDKLYFVGVDTDACVLKSAFDAADYDIPFEVLEDYCASSGGEELHEAAVRIIRCNLAHRRYE